MISDDLNVTPKKFWNQRFWGVDGMYKMNWTMLILAGVAALLFLFAKKVSSKKSDSIKVGSAIVGLLAIAGMIWAPALFPDFIGNAVKDSKAQSTGLQNQELALSGACPTDGDSSIKVNVYNKLNTSGSENYDTTIYVLDEDGAIVDIISDTTSPSATTVNCGGTYYLAAVASDSDGGDNSMVRSTNIGTVTDGKVKFKAEKSNLNFILELSQHGVAQFALYDNVDARFAYDTGDASNSGYEADGTTFTDGDNATAFAMTAGSYLDFTIKMQGTGVDTDVQDAYILVGVEAPVTEYNEPTVKFEGVKLSDIKDSGLTSDEVKALANYEYVYKITSKIEDDPHDIGFYIKATDANPSTDLQIDFFPAGNFKATSAQVVKTGAAQDDSSKTVVYTTQDVTIDVS
jgi:hypothetical protein